MHKFDLYKSELGREMIERIIDGAVVLAGTADANLFRQSIGFAEKSTGVPMDSDTIIDIASITKIFTATALAICHDRGLVDYDAPFVHYLPDYYAKLSTPITVRDLVLHLSGFDNMKGRNMVKAGADCHSLLLSYTPDWPARTQYHYACWNYLLLGLIVERISGNTLPEFCRNHIFGPLGMNDTSLGVPVTNDISRLARTCETDRPGQIADSLANRLYGEGRSAGNAGAFSTADDLAIFCRFMLNGGRPLISAAEFSNELTVNHVPETFGIKRGIGWAISDEFTPSNWSARTIHHSGYTGQSIFIDLERKFFVVILTTRMDEYVRAKNTRSRIAYKLMELYQNEILHEPRTQGGNVLKGQ